MPTQIKEIMEKFYENIDDYLNGKLPEGEKKAFEKALAAQPELQVELDLYKKVEGSLSTHFSHEKENAALKDSLTSISGDYFSTENKEAKVIPMKRNRFMQGLIAAAAVALILVFAWPYLFTPAPAQYADLVHHPKASFTEMGASEANLEAAEKAFNDGNFQAAIEPLQAYLLAHENSMEAWFYIGICKLETGEEDSAEMLFKQVTTIDSAYKIEARWYLALTYLKKGEIEKCKVELEKIPEGSEHFEAAQKALKTLG